MVQDASVSENAPKGEQKARPATQPVTENRPSMFGIPVEPMPDFLTERQLPRTSGGDRKKRVLTGGGYYILRGFEEPDVQFTDEKTHTGQTEAFLRNYDMLKTNGFPVVEGVRVVEQANEEKLVMVPDVTDGGKKGRVYGIGKLREIARTTESAEFSQASSKPFDDEYKRIMAEEGDLVKSQGEALRDKATALGITLAYDGAWDLVVNRADDGVYSWKLQILDPEEYNTPPNEGGLKATNDEIFDLQNGLFGGVAKFMDNPDFIKDETKHPPVFPD